MNLTMQQMREKAVRDGVPTWAVERADRRAEKAREKEEPGETMVMAARAAFAAAMKEYADGRLSAPVRPRSCADLVRRALSVGTPLVTIEMAKRAYTNRAQRLSNTPLPARNGQAEAAFLQVVAEELDRRDMPLTPMQRRVLTFLTTTSWAPLVQEVCDGLGARTRDGVDGALSTCVVRGYVRVVKGRAKGGRTARRFLITEAGRLVL